MLRMYRRSADGVILCGHCAPAVDLSATAELMPHLFPGTYHKLTCTVCGSRPPNPEAAEPVTPALADGAGGLAEPCARPPRST